MTSSISYSDLSQINRDNIVSVLGSVYMQNQNIEQSRWTEGNTDTLFHAGDQRSIQSNFYLNPAQSFYNFHFNIVQPTCNLVTGYQRQHRKSIQFLPAEMSDSKANTQMTRIIDLENKKNKNLELFSDGCEQSLVSGMILLQPYLDYLDDPINGTLKTKLWPFNSFLMDPYWKEPDMSDCNFVWCQQYLSKMEAYLRFPKYTEMISTMAGARQSDAGQFYFLPENYNLGRSDLLVLSYFWYRQRTKRKKLYNRLNGTMLDWYDTDKALKQFADQFPQMEVLEVEIPAWKQAVLLNDQCMYIGDNPLGFSECPFVPVFWNYDPHISSPDLRVRSLVRSMRDAQFLLNRRIIINHDISESSVNTGWIKRENAIADADVTKRVGQGIDIEVKDDFRDTPLQDVIQKITPNQVPPSDLQLAEQLQELAQATTNVNQELLGAAVDDKAGITEMLRQGAGLVGLQKYFDQWDRSLKILGKLQMRIIQINWSPIKVARMLNEEPAPEFFAKAFSDFDVIVEEGLNTPTQQTQQFIQLLKFQEVTGIQIPAQLYLKNAPIQGKDELIQALTEQEQQQAAMQDQQMKLNLALLDAQLQREQAGAVSDIAMARERHGRAESNIGLFEERLSEITHNRAMSVKAKVEALKNLLETMSQYGMVNVDKGSSILEGLSLYQESKEDREKVDAKQTAISNSFVQQMMTAGLQGLQGVAS